MTASYFTRTPTARGGNPRKDAAALSLDAGQIGSAGAKTKVLSGRTPVPRKAGEKLEDDGSGAAKIADYLSSNKLV